ncbi:Ig-like domain-containing protein, partial [Enterococcus faecium]|uniref:Ig-like domain-containing protein n=1 Tax=Enterococcus faecium TaxID=1352 RepID=UPI001178999F
TALTSIDLPEVTSIGGYAFRYVPLENVSLPKAIDFGSTPFDAHRVKTVELGMKDSDTLQTVADLFSNSKDSITDLTVHNITDTGDFTVTTASFKSLEKVSLPNVTRLGNRIFANNKLSSVDFPEVTTLGISPFLNGKMNALNLPKLKVAHKESWIDSNLDYVFFPAASAAALRPSFDSNPEVIGVGITTTDKQYDLVEEEKAYLTFDDVIWNAKALDTKENKLQAIYTKAEMEFKGDPLDYQLMANADTAGNYQGRLVFQNAQGGVKETGITRNLTVNVKMNLKAPEVDPVNDKMELLTGKGLKGAEVVAKVNDEEIGKGKVTDQGTFELKIAKQKVNTKISVTQTYDGEESPATEVTVTHKEDVKAP